MQSNQPPPSFGVSIGGSINMGPNSILLPTGQYNNEVNLSTGNTYNYHGTEGVETEREELENICSFSDNDVTVLPATKQDFESHKKKPEAIYQIKTKPKGQVLILNFTKFPAPLAPIPSGIEEGILLKKLFEGLGCEVTECNNKTAQEIREILEEFSTYLQHHNVDFCAVFILSHGSHSKTDGDVFFGTDGQRFRAAQVLEYFNDDRCSNLKGKPKLFFFEFCRALTRQPTPQTNNEVMPYPTDDLPEPQEFITRLISAQTRASTEGSADGLVKDVLVVYATRKGDVSNLRCFTNAILNVFSKRAKNKHIYEMLLEIKRGMDKDGRQMMAHSDELHKKFYFFPGFPE